MGDGRWREERWSLSDVVAEPGEDRGYRPAGDVAEPVTAPPGPSGLGIAGTGGEAGGAGKPAGDRDSAAGGTPAEGR